MPSTLTLSPYEVGLLTECLSISIDHLCNLSTRSENSDEASDFLNTATRLRELSAKLNGKSLSNTAVLS